MNNLQLIVFLSVGAVSILLVILYITTYREDRQQRTLQREAMQDTVKRFRLSKMLAFVGIKPEEYVANLPNEEISQHVSKCILCADIPSCDAFFDKRSNHNSDKKLSASELKFCPNYDALVTYKKMMPAISD